MRLGIKVVRLVWFFSIFILNRKKKDIKIINKIKTKESEEKRKPKMKKMKTKKIGVYTPLLSDAKNRGDCTDVGASIARPRPVRNTLENNHGITLIVLIVTIIILVILARHCNQSNYRRQWLN